MNNKSNDNNSDNDKVSDVLSTFDDISLCDNNSSNDDFITKNANNNSDNELNDKNELTCDKSEDKQSMDSSPIETPICGSNADEDELISDEMNDNSDFIEELKMKNGIVFDLKFIEDKYENKIIELQTERNELQNQIEDSKRLLSDQEMSFKDIKSRLMANIEKANKQNESTRKELESMVIKYATAERDVIQLKKVREDVDKKLKDVIKDKDSLMVRIKGLSNDKTQLMASIDRKVVEISSLQRDYDKLNDQLKDRDNKWKQTKNKLKDEVMAHNETKTKLDSVMQSMVELREEVEGLRRELNSSEDNDRTSNESGITKMEQLSNELENYKKKMSSSIIENHSLTTKIQSLERERLDHEQSVSKLKETVNELQLKINDYISKLRDRDQLRQQLDREKELVSDFQKESERLKSSNNDLRAEMESCRHKEGELLEFTERLTAKTVHLQSEHNILEQKSVMLNEDVETLQKQCEELSKENSSLNQSLDQLKESHQREIGLLAKKLAEKTKLSDDLKVKVDELENEIRVNKRRHVTSVKELNKELFSMRKRLEHFDGQTVLTQSDSLSIGSRTSSSNSLTDALSGNNHTNSSSVASQSSQPKIAVSIPPQSSTDSTNYSSMPTTSLLPEVDKQVLIDRIIRLQKSLAKRNEKIDFLEEHNQQLIHEMKKKSKLVQYYILREETGALSTTSMDDHKDKQKKRQLAKRGTGIMSSLYNSSPNDATMTLELSLEINKKLQAVLEDTILKNITLKESLNTLGTEIARLTNDKEKP